MYIKNKLYYDYELTKEVDLFGELAIGQIDCDYKKGTCIIRNRTRKLRKVKKLNSYDVFAFNFNDIKIYIKSIKYENK